MTKKIFAPHYMPKHYIQAGFILLATCWLISSVFLFLGDQFFEIVGGVQANESTRKAGALLAKFFGGFGLLAFVFCLAISKFKTTRSTKSE